MNNVIPSDATTDIGVLLDLFLNKPNRLISPFFKERELRSGNTKGEMRAALQGALDSSEISPKDVVSFLNELDGWGDQHIFIFQTTLPFAAQYKNRKNVEAMLRKASMWGKYNQTVPVVLPEERQLCSIASNDYRFQMRWIERRITSKRLPDADRVKGDISYRAYLNNTQRAVTTFDWDLVTGVALILIQELQTNADYMTELIKYTSELQPLFGFGGNFNPLPLSSCIHKIEKHEPVLRRQIGEQTIIGGRAKFTSPDRTLDAFHADADLQSSRKGLGDKTVPFLGNFYWKPTPPDLERSIHVKVYGDDDHVGIFGSCTETEVRYLLSRIIRHC